MKVTATATEPSTHTRTAGHIRTMKPGMATRTAWSTQASSAPGPACAPWASRSGCLPATATAQVVIYVVTGSVALLADLIHNFGDALTAVPLGTAFLLRSGRAERYAGLAVVFAIFVSACVAGVFAIEKIISPEAPTHLLALGIAGAIGCLGNELAAQIRLRAGRRLDSPALLADGYHARTDGFVSLGVMLSAALVALGIPLADPVIAIVITGVILRITWQSWETVRQGHHHD